MDAFELVLAKHRTLLALTLQLRDCARAELWDEVVNLQPQQAQQLEFISQDPIDFFRENVGQGPELSKLLGQIYEANSEVIMRTLAWRGELQLFFDELATAQTVSAKLARAYRS